jgi:hypothetical protein
MSLVQCPHQFSRGWKNSIPSSVIQGGSNNALKDHDQVVVIKVINFVSVGVLFFQLEWNVSVSECFGVPFRGCTVYIYIYIYNKHNSNSR